MTHEVGALIEACGEILDRVAITPAQDMQGAIAGRVFNSLGPLAAPARLVHDAVAALSYGAVRLGARAGSAGAAGVLRIAAGERTVRPFSESRRGRFMISAANGLLGDLLQERRSELAITMSLRLNGEDVGLDRNSLAGGWARATPRLVLFLHGLGESEELWTRRADGEGRLDFGERLRAGLGLTPVFIRYNSGLPVADNGRHLAGLLEELLAGWPVPVTDLVLVGHSMGGLVIRAACDRSPGWLAVLRHVVTLGTPHTGAPIEKGLHLAARALRLLPEGRPVAALLDTPSAGIRDLRLGIDSALPPSAEHTFIGATVSPSPNHPVGWAMGDLLVRSDSAAGRHRRRGATLAPASAPHLGGLSHFDLLDHPEVYRHLAEALGRTFAEAQLTS